MSLVQVFSNCREPNLLPEVLVGEPDTHHVSSCTLPPSGEHIRIEMIQLNDDHSGGRILARYESPTHTFLFPSNQSPAVNRIVEVTMNRSRKYKVRENDFER